MQAGSSKSTHKWTMKLQNQAKNEEATTFSTSLPQSPCLSCGGITAPHPSISGHNKLITPKHLLLRGVKWSRTTQKTTVACNWNLKKPARKSESITSPPLASLLKPFWFVLVAIIWHQVFEPRKSEPTKIYRLWPHNSFFLSMLLVVFVQQNLLKCWLLLMIHPV